MAISVGADIKAHCNKCKLTTWHVIVAMVGTRIAKCQCKSCSAQHRYKAPAGTTATAKGVTTRRATKKKTSLPESNQPSVQPDLKIPIKQYSPRETFAVGERVDHFKFGIGVVESLPGSGKMQVCFADGRRVLAMAREQIKRPG